MEQRRYCSLLVTWGDLCASLEASRCPPCVAPCYGVLQLECMSSPLVPFSAKSMSMAAIGAVEAASDVIVKRQLDRCVHVCPTHFALHALYRRSAWSSPPV